MTIQEFIDKTTKGAIPLSDLTSIAADRAAFGDDVLAALRSQVEQRSASAQKVLDDATTANRDSLLASEQRSFDAHTRERDQILRLLQAVEQRTEQRAYVPPTQTTPTETRTEDVSPVLGKEQRCAEWLTKRGGFHYAGEKGIESLRFGRIVRALALGDRRGMSALEQRVLSEGTDSAGGYTVPEALSTSLIDRVRNAMVVMRAGAVTVPMTSDVLHIARLGQPDSVSPPITTAQWKAENADIEETDLLLERVSFSAKTLPVLLKLSVELSEDSVNIDTAIERELSAQLALELDRVALLGSGSAPEPRGVRNQSGVHVEDFAGATPTNYDHAIDAIGRLWALNHEPTGRISNASYAVMLAKFKSSADDQPLRVPEVVAAVPSFRTQQIANAGVSPDTTSLYVADWSNLMIGMRTSFRMEVSRVAGDAFKKLQIWVRCYLRADVQLAHPEAFDVTVNVGY